MLVSEERAFRSHHRLECRRSAGACAGAGAGKNAKLAAERPRILVAEDEAALLSHGGFDVHVRTRENGERKSILPYLCEPALIFPMIS